MYLTMFASVSLVTSVDVYNPCLLPSWAFSNIKIHFGHVSHGLEGMVKSHLDSQSIASQLTNVYQVPQDPQLGTK